MTTVSSVTEFPTWSRSLTGRPTPECGAGQCPQGRLRQRSALGIRPPLTALTSPDDRQLSSGPKKPGAVGMTEQLRRLHGDDGASSAMSLAHSVTFQLGNTVTVHKQNAFS